MTANREIILIELPLGELKSKHFAWPEGTVGSPGEGELLVGNVLMSIDAANRTWMQGATYR